MVLSTSRKRPLRGAVIGFGFISSKGHIPAYLIRSRIQKDVEIVAVADISDSRRNQIGEILAQARIYSSYETLLAAESDQIDFVDICTPPCDHAKIASAALNRGLHVLCEKPLATTIEDAKSLLALAKLRRKVIFPCHNYKHAPVIQSIQSVIQSGRIGQIRSITLNTFRNTHAKGTPEWRANWRREKSWSGGGIAMDHGSHSFYLMFEWLKSYPISVSAKMMNSSPHLYDTEDQFSAIVTFPNGFAHACLTWTAGVRKVIYTLQGERGAITVEDDDLQVAIMQKNPQAIDVAQGAVEWTVERSRICSDWMDASHVNWFNSLFSQFISAIENQDFAGKEAQEALICVQLIHSAYASSNRACAEVILEDLPVELS